MFAWMKRIIESKKLKKKFFISMKEYKHKQTEYIAMSNEQFSLLPNEELFEAAFARVHHTVDSFDDMMVGIQSLSSPAKAFFVTEYYEMEVNNGGLCQFFVNSSRAVAPELSACLAEIGADEHKQHYDAFIQANGIDVNDLPSFDIENVSEHVAQTRQYDFDSFDDHFYEIKPICEYLSAYIKEHITEF